MTGGSPRRSGSASSSSTAQAALGELRERERAAPDAGDGLLHLAANERSQPLRAGMHRLERLLEHAEHGDAPAGLRDEREGEGPFERCQCELVRAERALQRVTTEPLDEGGATDDDSRLRPTEKLVAGEAHEIRAFTQALRRGRLVADPGERARAEVVDDGSRVPCRDLHELGEPGTLGEPHDAEVRLVHPQEERRIRADRALVVRGPGAIRRAYLDEAGTRAREDVRDAEAVPDLDQLPARDDDLPALRQGRERKQHRRGVVVDDERGLGARERAQERREVVLPRATLPRVEVVLERRVPAAHLDHTGERLVGERRPPEVRVDEDARGVQHAPQSRSPDAGQLFEHAVDEGSRVAPAANLLARPVEDGPRGGNREVVRLSRQPLVCDEAVDGGKVAKRELAGHPGQCRRAAVTPQARAGARAGAR